MTNETNKKPPKWVGAAIMTGLVLSMLFLFVLMIMMVFSQRDGPKPEANPARARLYQR